MRKTNSTIMNRYIPELIIIAVVVSLTCVAGVKKLNASDRAGSFVLMEPTEPRALALGASLIAENHWPQGVLLNPASAAGGGTTVNFSHARHLIDMWSGQVGLSYKILEKYTAGFYLRTFNYGDFDETTIETGPTGETFQAAEYVASGYVASELGYGISVGAAGKLIWGNIWDDRSAAIALDLGAIYNPQWEDTKFGIVLRNWGKQLAYYGFKEDNLPTELSLGISRKLAHLPLTVSAAGIFSQTGEGDYEADFLPGSPGISFSLGGEFSIPLNYTDKPLQLRLGYRSLSEGLRVGNRADTFAGISFGVGLPYKQFSFDYTFAPMGALGNVHRFGVSVNDVF